MKALKSSIYAPRNKLETHLKKIQEAVKQLEGCDSIRNELHKKIDESVPNLKNLKTQTEQATEVTQLYRKLKSLIRSLKKKRQK